MKTLISERRRLDKECRAKFGSDWNYDAPANYYKHKLIRNLKQHPLSCSKIKDVADVENVYIPSVRTKEQCSNLKKFWSPKVLSYENNVDTGTCFTKPNFKNCAEQEDPLLRRRMENNEYYLPGDAQLAQRKCDVMTKCVYKKGKCVYEAPKVIPLDADWPVTLTGTFQDYLANYYSSLSSNFPSLIGTGNRCTRPEIEKTLKQDIIANIFKGFMNKKSRSRGLLVWHSTGSGKTCVSMSIMDTWWDSDSNIVYTTSVEAMAANPIKTFAKCAMKLFTRFENLSEEQVIKEIDSRVHFLSFAKLAHHLLIANPLRVTEANRESHVNLLRDAVLIIDEAHNLLKPKPGQHIEYNALVKFLNTRTSDNKPIPTQKFLKIALLTATPGNNERELVTLLNIIRRNGTQEITIPKEITAKSSSLTFKNQVSGLVSYFNMNNDTTRFPIIQTLPDNIAPMKSAQYEAYIKALKANTNNNYEYLLKIGKLEKYFSKARKYSNTLYEYQSGVELSEFSSKLPVLLHNISKYDNEKHYIYSAFFHNQGYGGQGIRAIARILSDRGYTKFSVADARKNELPTPQKRYILALTSEIASSERGGAGKNMKSLMDMFNRPENKNGEYIQIFLASQNFNEGLDFKDLRNIHIFEPLVSSNAQTQTIGRAARHCSHSNLPLTQWVVRVHRYIADFPTTIKLGNTQPIRSKINELQQQIKEKKNVVENRKKIKQLTKELNQFDIKSVIMIDKDLDKIVSDTVTVRNFMFNVLKQQAVDCKIYQKFHESGGEKITCDEKKLE